MANDGNGDGYDWLYGGAADPARDRSAGGARRDGTTKLPPSNLPPPILPPPGGRRSGGADDRGARARKRFGAGKILLLLIVAWISFLIITPLYAFTTLETVPATPQGDRPEQRGGSTFLLVGSDSRDDERKGSKRGRTDTIMLLHSGRGPSVMVSLPRDSLVEVPGYGVTKINAAYAYGGAELLVQTIESNTGVRVDDYVEIGFDGLKRVVDAVGGVEICPKDAVKDRDARLNIKAGCQEADGRTALAYARVRKAYQTGDVQRVQNQREVMSGIATKVASPMTFINPVRYWRVNTGAASSVVVGEGTAPTDLIKFALALRGAMADNGMSCTVPIADFSVRWDSERSARMFELIANDQTDQIGKLCTPDGLPAN